MLKIHFRNGLVALTLLLFAVVFCAPHSVLAQRGDDFCPPPVKYIHLLKLRAQQGLDVTKAEEKGRKARKFMEKQDRRQADKILGEAIALLLDMGEPVSEVCPPRGEHGNSQPMMGDRGSAPQHKQQQETKPYVHKMDNPFFIPEKLRKRLEEEKKGNWVTPPPGASDYNDSPFGIYGPYEIVFDNPLGATTEEINAYMLDLGVVWAQEPPFSLDKLPPSLSLYTRIGREGGTRPGTSDFSRYEEVLRKRIRHLKDRVKVYELGTEPDGVPPPTAWKGKEKEYAKFLQVSHRIVKEECPDGILVFGGLTGVSTRFSETRGPALFLDQVLAAGGVGAFDAFEFKQHMFNADQYTEIGRKYRTYAKIMKKHGINIDSMPVYLEVATHDGHPQFAEGTPLWFLNSSLAPQTEMDQAVGLVKIYMYSLAQGIDKIFWDLVVEHHRFGGNENNPFDVYGLVHNKYNEDGLSHKKLAYFAYKKMTATFKHADFKHLQTITETDDLFVYEIPVKKGGRIWVAWSETVQPQQVNLVKVQGATVQVIRSVPDAATGLEVEDRGDVHDVRVLDVNNGHVSIAVGTTPLYIVESGM